LDALADAIGAYRAKWPAASRVTRHGLRGEADSTAVRRLSAVIPSFAQLAVNPGVALPLLHQC